MPINLMDIEWLTPAPLAHTDYTLALFALAVIVLLLMLAFILGLRRKLKPSTASKLRSLQRRLQQGEPVQTVALALYQLLQQPECQHLTLNSEQKTHLQLAGFSSQSLAPDLLSALLTQLEEKASC